MEVWRSLIVTSALMILACFIIQTCDSGTRAKSSMGLLQHASGCQPHDQPEAKCMI